MRKAVTAQLGTTSSLHPPPLPLCGTPFSFPLLCAHRLPLFVLSFRYDWKLAEAKKNILRTHTTAVSARMLKLLADQVPTL